MGEFSKRIGEVGEEIVVDFLTLIGWHQPVRNFDIPSIDSRKHEKNSHGMLIFIIKALQFQKRLKIF